MSAPLRRDVLLNGYCNDPSVGDWEQFVDEVTWFLSPGDSVDVDVDGPWSRGPIVGLPLLSGLLLNARVTPVSVNGRNYELLAWGQPGKRRGWLCLPPATNQVEELHPTHHRFLTVCGGIIECFREPLSWWNNQNEVLTESAAKVPLGPVLADYAWIWRDEGLDVPIRPEDFYPVAVEANGNLTLCQRATGQILVFAPDHDFEGATPLRGCPPYSLMTMDGTPDLATWIERCAKAWTQN